MRNDGGMRPGEEGEKFMRIGIKFQRKGLKKYVSHLDMQRLFARALRRSGLPVKYSSGFNPHINLSLDVYKRQALF